MLPPKDYAEPQDDHYRPEMAIVWLVLGMAGVGLFIAGWIAKALVG
jgi:hypothetical protein